MKYFILIVYLTFSSLVFSQEFGEYDLIPYNEGLKFKKIDNNQIIKKDSSLQALIIVFNPKFLDNIKLSISNNPQLKEIKVFGGNQELLNYLSIQKLPSLSHLFYERYERTVLEVPAFPKVEHLTIQSDKLVSLDMLNASLDTLGILDIDAPILTKWITAKSFPELGLIDLNAPLLESFPIENMPKISQFSYNCSFKQLPKNLCEYEELLFISFTNYSPIVVDKCIVKKIEKGVYSNLTVYDKVDGKVISQTLSKDRKE